MRKKMLCVFCILLSVVCLTAGALAAEGYRERSGDMVYVKTVKAEQNPAESPLEKFGPGPDGKFADIKALFEYWVLTNAQPDWICSVSSTDGSGERLTVVVNSAAAGETLRSMLTDPGTLTVEVSEGGYSETQLLRVMDEISDTYMGSGELASICVGWTTIDGKVTGFGESGKEFRVVVRVLPEHAERYRKELETQYGDMVYVEAGGPVFSTPAAAGTVDSVLREDMGQQPGNSLYIGGLAAVLLCVLGVLAMSRSRTPTEQARRNALKKPEETEKTL